MNTSGSSSVALQFDPSRVAASGMAQRSSSVVLEHQWRSLAVGHDGQSPVVAGLWSDRSTCIKAAESVIPHDVYVLSIFMRPARIELQVDAQRVHVGTVAAGSFYLSYPGQKISNVFFGACECLSIYLCADFISTTLGGGTLSLSNGLLVGIKRDPVIEQLARTLLSTDAQCCESKCAERMSMPILNRLSHLLKNEVQTQEKGRRIAMPSWRVERVTAYIREHIAEAITLADMASAATLSPMHFAAQFKATTGYRPHDYLLICRIDKAKQLLSTSNAPLIDVAMDVGFRTQAHFSTVFKKITSLTPSGWRGVSR